MLMERVPAPQETRNGIEAMRDGEMSQVDRGMVMREAARSWRKFWKAKWPMRWDASFSARRGCTLGP
jgi:hypothetical protein